MPEFYWRRMSPREKKGVIAVLVAAFILMTWSIMNPEAGRFHWQDVIPGWFGVSPDIFTFWMLVIGIVGLSFAVMLFLVERRKGSNVKVRTQNN